jgi:hypothetical protein|tara:strand:+ start:1511 stop:2854 length:1344 start_codon:yes stop_codon:yes gene_type:complete
MISENGNYKVLYDLSRPFVWKFTSTDAVNLLYQIHKADPMGNWVAVSGILRQPKEYGTAGDFFINPSEILADEIETQIRFKNQYAAEVMYTGSVRFKLIMTEELVAPSGEIYYNSNMNAWYNTGEAYGIDAATQHEETFNLSQSTFYDIYRTHMDSSTQNGLGHFLTSRPMGGGNLPFKQSGLTKQSHTDNDYAYIFNTHKATQLRYIISPFSEEIQAARPNVWSGNISNALYDGLSNKLGKGLNSIGVGVPNIIEKIGVNAWNSIKDAAYRVSYWVQDHNAAQVSEIGHYIIDKEKCSTERLRVYWKNRKGGIDGYTFNSELQVTTSVKSKLTKSPLGHRRSNTEDINSMGYLFNNTYGSSSRTLSSTNIIANETITVKSKFHIATELRWLSEIITSPQIWVENLQTGKINAVYSVTKQMNTKPKGKSVGQMTLSLRMSNEILTQR